MKKSISLILAVLLLVSIIGTALAECSHNWYTVSTSTKLVKTTYVQKANGCTRVTFSHKHTQKLYETTQIFVCSKGCGKVKKVVSHSIDEKCPF